MNKTLLKLIPFMFLFSISVSSCNFYDIFPPSTPGGDVEFPDEDDDPEVPSGAGYYRANRTEFNYHDLGQQSYYGCYSLDTTGEQNILVVPIVIKGYERYATNGVRNNIQKAFFGTSEETGWESVSSYFYKCSYGQLTLKGAVTNWFECGLTPSQITKRQYDNCPDLGTIDMAGQCRDFAISQGYDMKDFDKDKDGYIDALYMVYAAPSSSNYNYSSESVNELMWAFVYWDYKNIDRPSTANPVTNTYAWSSYDWMTESSTIKVDAHAYIHEMGHVLGLQDYYDYDGLHNPLGAFDMQDHNVGDHNAYSKFALGWTKPYVVTDDCEITIKPSNTYGHSILIKDPETTWNKTAFDEYLMLELLTPEVLWEQDATYKNPSIGTKTFQSSGVRLLHVDSRLANSSNRIVTSITQSGIYYEAFSNTPSSSYSSGTSSLRADQVAMIPADKNTRFQTSSKEMASDSSLFKTGDKFSVSSYSSFFSKSKLHNGEEIPFEIEFISVTNEEAVIKFTKI